MPRIKRGNQVLPKNTPLYKRPGVKSTRATTIKKTNIVDLKEKCISNYLINKKLEMSVPLGKIVSISYSPFKKEEIVALSSFKVQETEMDNISGVNSLKMGSISRCEPCNHCGKTDCLGHMGKISLNNLTIANEDINFNYIYNPLYIRYITYTLNTVCSNCYHLLHSKDSLMLIPNLPNKFTARIKLLQKYKGYSCINCNNVNPIYSISDIHDGHIKSKHDKGKNSNSETIISPSQAYDIINNLSQEDAMLLGFTSQVHPRDFFFSDIPMVPIISRPSREINGLKIIDQLSSSYQALYTNVVEFIKNSNNATSYKPSEKDVNISSIYKILHHIIVKADNTSSSKNKGKTKSISTGMGGKPGFVKTSLVKRGNYGARAPATQDPTLEADEVRIPEYMSKVLTVNETVTKKNAVWLFNLIKSGKVTGVSNPITGESYKPNKISKLIPGQVVERFSQTGDYVILSRQPILDKNNIMCVRLVVGSDKKYIVSQEDLPNVPKQNNYVFSASMHVTKPLNLDFDGDEINIYMLRSVYTRTEGRVKFSFRENLRSSSNAKPCTGLTMNGIIGCYLMSTSQNTVPSGIINLCKSIIGNSYTDLDSLSTRLNTFNIPENSPKALFAMTLPKNFLYNRRGVVIVNGILIKGTITKADVGDSSGGIMDHLIKEYSSERACYWMEKTSMVCNIWLEYEGFTCGLRDLAIQLDDNVDELVEYKNVNMETELKKMKSTLIKSAKPIKNKILEKARIMKINNALDVVETVGLKISKQALKRNNNIVAMTSEASGAKGSGINVGAIMGAVGQQFINGNRIENQMSRNTRAYPGLPFTGNPEDNGFIPNSYTDGLSPKGLFFLQMGSRPSMIDLNSGTIFHGYTQRRLVEAVSSVLIDELHCMREMGGRLINPTFNNGYALDQIVRIKDDEGTYYAPIDVSSVIETLNAERGWVPEKIKDDVNVRANKIKTKSKMSDKKYNSEYKKIMGLNSFEKTAVIAFRAAQLESNADQIITDQHKSVEIHSIQQAINEYSSGGLNGKYGVIRKLPNNTSIVGIL